MTPSASTVDANMKNMIIELIDTFANIEYGILIAMAIDAVLLLLISVFKQRRKFTALSFVVAILLLIPLTFQMSRLIGACSMSDTASTASNLVSSVSTELGSYISTSTSPDIGWFIFRRVMWSVLFLGVGAVCISYTMDTVENPRSNSVRHYDRSATRRTRSHRYSN